MKFLMLVCVHMQVREIGIVVSVKGNIAAVKASRHNDCENCGACPGSSAIIIEADNQVNAQPGQQVYFVVEQVNMLLAAFVVYIFPLLFTTLAVMAALYAAQSNNITVGTTILVAVGVVSFGLSIIIVRSYEHWVRKKTSMLPTIIEIV